MSELDPTIVQLYSDFLARKARAIVTRWAVACSLLGGALGAVTLTSWASWPVTGRSAYGLVLLGAIAGGIAGRSLGSSRATGVRLQAQLAQHQVEFERSALAAGRAVVSAAEEAPAVPVPFVLPAPAGAPPVSAPVPVQYVSAPPVPVQHVPVEPVPQPVQPVQPVPAVQAPVAPVYAPPPVEPAPQPYAEPAPVQLAPPPAPAQPWPVQPAPAPAASAVPVSYPVSMPVPPPDARG